MQASREFSGWTPSQQAPACSGSIGAPIGRPNMARDAGPEPEAPVFSVPDDVPERSKSFGDAFGQEDDEAAFHDHALQDMLVRMSADCVQAR